jgi:hypothetical protein
MLTNSLGGNINGIEEKLKILGLKKAYDFWIRIRKKTP